MILSSDKLQKKLIGLMHPEGVDLQHKLPKYVCSADCHKKLNRHNVDDGVYLLSRYLGMAGSCGSDIDMYRVMQAYLLDPAMRQSFNQLLQGWRQV